VWMKILKIAHRVPWPLDSGSKIHTYHDLKHLSTHNDVTLVAPAFNDEECKGYEKLTTICDNVVISDGVLSGPWVSALKSIVRGNPYRVEKMCNNTINTCISNLFQDKHFDVIWVHYLNTLYNIPVKILRNNTIILDQHDSMERVWEKYAAKGSFVDRLFAKFNLVRVREFRNKMMELVDIVLSTSSKDAAFIRDHSPESTDVWLEPNGVNDKYYSPTRKSANNPSGRPTVLFCGSMNIKMNIDAVVRFSHNILPLVKSKVPDTQFLIVGRNPTRQVKGLADLEGISVTGSVADVRPYYDRAWISVAPFKFGGGSKLKVLESMAMGVPLVSTQTGVQGVEAQPSKHLLIANEAEDFSKSVIELLRDSCLRNNISDEARELVCQKYTWKTIVYNTLEKLNRYKLERKT